MKKTNVQAAPAQKCDLYDLHAAIIKLPCDSKNADLWDRSDKELRAYQIGHRDARHGAAQLIAAQLACSSAKAAPAPDSIDTPEFQRLMHMYRIACFDPYSNVETKAVHQTRAAIVAYIDAHIDQRRFPVSSTR